LSLKSTSQSKSVCHKPTVRFLTPFTSAHHSRTVSLSSPALAHSVFASADRTVSCYWLLAI
jgi:hypothetical protein